MTETAPQTPRTPMQKANAWLFRRRIRLAASLARALTKGAMHVSPVSKASLVGISIFWYVQNGQRKFLLIKPHNEEKSRFCSFVDLEKNKTAADRMRAAVTEQLGEVFIKALNKSTLSGDHVVAAPTFHSKDEHGRQQVPVQALIWVTQITATQAELAATNAEKGSLEILSEGALLAGGIEAAHRLLYQAAMRHVHNHQGQQTQLLSDALQDVLREASPSERIIH